MWSLVYGGDQTETKSGRRLEGAIFPFLSSRRHSVSTQATENSNDSNDSNDILHVNGEVRSEAASIFYEEYINNPSGQHSPLSVMRALAPSLWSYQQQCYCAKLVVMRSWCIKEIR
jgi:hypothetical protein